MGIHDEWAQALTDRDLADELHKRAKYSLHGDAHRALLAEAADRITKRAQELRESRSEASLLAVENEGLIDRIGT